MQDWFNWKNAGRDFMIAGGIFLPAWWWFGSVLGLPGMAAVSVGAFGLMQLARFVNAQFATLQWATLYGATLREKRKATVANAPLRDGYREAGVIAEEPPPPDDEYYEREVPRRRRRARISLGVVGAAAALTTLVPGFAWGAWAVPAFAAFLIVLTGLFFFTMGNLRRREAQNADFFMQHLERDTKAMLEKKKTRVAEEPAHLRVGVDFGVPAEELKEEAEAEPDVTRRSSR